MRHLDMDGVGGTPDKALLMSLNELSVELEGLEFIIGTEVERNISEAEGKYHQGGLPEKVQLCKSLHVNKLKTNKLLNRKTQSLCAQLSNALR